MIWIIFGVPVLVKMPFMKTASFRAWLMAAVVAFGMWLVAPTVADAYPSLGVVAILADCGSDANYPGLRTAESAACLGDIGLHGACCVFSNFGCLACMLIPPDPATVGPSPALTFASALAETATGVGPGRVKRPPRSAR